MRVLAHGGALGHRLDHGPPEILGVRAREADAFDPLDRVDRAQELREVGAEIASVRVDVLPQQRHLAHALLRQSFDLGEHVAGPPRHLASAHCGDDAVRADGVAAHRDLHPRLEHALAVHRQRGGEGPLLPRPPCAARDAEAARAEPLPEMRDRARAERDVDVRIQLEQPLTLCLGVAAADGDHGVRLCALLRDRVADVRGESRVRLLADRAGVEDDHVRLLLRGSLAEAELLEHALDPLGVVSVHLAAERRDVVAPHGREW